MKTDCAHEETKNGITIRIVYDDCPMNPFTECDCGPDIITFLRSYDFSTEKESANDPESFLELAKERGYFFRPLYAYIHSGIAFSMTRGGQFSDQFDSGFAGFIYWTPKKREQAGLTDSYIESILREGETVESWLESSLESAVNVLNDYASGNCYGFQILNSDGEELDSCYGFLGDYDKDGGALCEAQSNLAFHVKEETKKEREAIAAGQARLVGYENELKVLGLTTLDCSLSKGLMQERIEQEKDAIEKAKARLAELEGKEESESIEQAICLDIANASLTFKKD